MSTPNLISSISHIKEYGSINPCPAKGAGKIVGSVVSNSALHSRFCLNLLGWCITGFRIKTNCHVSSFDNLSFNPSNYKINEIYGNKDADSLQWVSGADPEDTAGGEGWVRNGV